MRDSKRIVSAGLGLLAVLWLQPALAQEPEGEFVDGEFVEGYTYAPDFMPPEELKAAIEAQRDDIVIVDTAAPLIWEDEHIPGAVNYPWVHELAMPVTLPREKTLVLYCACKDHEDSADMAKKLSLVGFLNVKVLEGGWFEWLDLGYPTVSKAEEDASESG
jgi:rhodanese-related sulfurtransferase